MNRRFADVVQSLEPRLKELLAMEPCTAGSLPTVIPESGIYLFSEHRQHLYVGRSDGIRGRIGRHCRPGATHRMASFAFRLAREATGRLQATYRPEGSRAALITEPVFRAAFDSAKHRIRQMQVRFVEESDPLRQMLLEAYVAVALETPYNDFANH
jgi:hypothetical protein